MEYDNFDTAQLLLKNQKYVAEIERLQNQLWASRTLSTNRMKAIQHYRKVLQEANGIYLLRDSWKPMNEIASEMNEVLEKALKGVEPTDEV